MPNFHPNQPNPKIQDWKMLKTQLTTLGLDTALFAEMVDKGVPTESLRRFFRKKKGDTYSWSTIRRWKMIYLESKQ